jgi:hypothetical protein
MRQPTRDGASLQGPCCFAPAFSVRTPTLGRLLLSPGSVAGLQTGAFLHSGQKRYKGRANILPHQDVKKINRRLEKSSLDCVPVEKFLCAVPAIRNTSSYVFRKSRFTIWSWRRDLNPRPSDYKSDALPAELRQHKPPVTGHKVNKLAHTAIRVQHSAPRAFMGNVTGLVPLHKYCSKSGDFAPARGAAKAP